MKKGDLTEKLYEELKKRNLFEEDDKDESKNEDNEGGSENKDFKDMVSSLLHSRTQVHVFHWQTKSQSSFAEHMALGGFYDEIGDLFDGLVESFQGKYDIVKNYETMDIENYSGVDQLISYFRELDKTVEEKRKGIKESYLQNQIDGIQELIFSTLYKLRFLK
jgi:DNA-binding ferritin-like protein